MKQLISRLASALAARRHKARGPARRLTRRARVGLEELEGRSAPSMLAFATNAFAVGWAALENTVAVHSWRLANGSFHNTLAQVNPPDDSNSMAQAEADLSYSYYNAHQFSIEENTSAYAGAYDSARAQLNLSPGVQNGGPGFVSVYIAPSYRGEMGRYTLVTLSATYQNTNTTNTTSTTGHNFVQVSYNNGGYGYRNLLMGSDYKEPPGGQVIRNSVSFYARVGSTFTICQALFSYAPQGNAAGAALTLDVRIQ
jgi:hypothetical protein